jgi:ribosomal-protein-alanine N-acetyltransferase
MSRPPLRLPAPVTVRLAVPADASAIALLSRAEIEQDLPWRWTPQRVRRSIADAATNVVVAQRGASFAGFGIMSYGEDTAHLLLLAVPPAARRRGVASVVLAWLERVALAAGVSRVSLEARESNADAIAFYRRHGYRVTATEVGMYLGLEDGVRLEKAIGSTS